MDASNPLALPPREFVRLVWSRRKLWATTTAACGVLAAVYSLLMPRYWEASQGLVVRQETAGSPSTQPGKFADLFEMRTMQETILELAKGQQVVVATLMAVDRQEGGAGTPPSLEEINEFRERLKMLPPDGGEFGKTEVFYFSIKAKGRDHAIRLVAALCTQLELALKELRSHRAGNLIAELDEQTKLAEQLLDVETQRLAEFEAHVGADLGELRMLHSANSGQSDLRMESVQLDADVRKFRTQVREGEKLIALLRAAQEDPQELIATPNSLLQSQPALRRIKDGLVDAQLATSRLGGTRSADHPRVRAALEAEAQIRADLHGELVTAIRGAEVELQLSRESLAATKERLDNLQGRFTELAVLRAEYSNRVAAVENCRQSLDRSRQNLGTAKAAQAAARSGSLVTRLDDSPETGPYPAGLGRTTMTGAGAVAGLLLGLGLTFLLAPASFGETTIVATQAETIRMEARPRRQAARDVEVREAVVAEPVAVAPMKPVKRSETPSPKQAVAPTPIAAAATPATSATFAPAVSTPIVATPVVPAAATVERPPVTPEKQRPKRVATLPPAPAMAATVATAVLPVAAGTLPGNSSSEAYGGMSLQEALQAAARQMTH